uniref:Uncharacterized protein n=1 Tax=Rhizophagus irregularis (strain DAOM 181602 / DAOM 197198 / MUCL 43194) TaxID=747089 RepID=U9SU13_RHIID
MAKRSEETGLRLRNFPQILARETQKAVKIYKLFEKVDVDKIKGSCHNSVASSEESSSSTPQITPAKTDDNLSSDD